MKNRRIFIIKTINLLLIGGILYGYQSFAVQRAEETAAYERKEALAEQAWAEANASEEMTAYEGANPEENGGGYQDGIFQGSGAGFGGEITVQVEIENGQIISAEILSAEKETEDYLKAAEKVLEDVVETQSNEVDAVSGATFSSQGILEAVGNALEGE